VAARGSKQQLHVQGGTTLVLHHALLESGSALQEAGGTKVTPRQPLLACTALHCAALRCTALRCHARC